MRTSFHITQRNHTRNAARREVCHSFLIALVLTCGCSSSKRHPEAETPDDAGTDEDAGLPWDGGNDDFEVAQPGLLTTEGRNPSLGFDGENLGLAWSDDKIETEEADFHTLFVAFPWSQPEAAQWGSFPQEPPACYGGYSWSGPVSKPYPAQEGFFVLTSTIGNDSCQVVRSLWSTEADLVDGPDTWHDVYPPEHYHVMSPFGVQNPDGTVVVGNLKCVGCTEDPPTGAEVVFQIDRFGPDGLHESLLEESFDWSGQAPETGHVFSGYGGQNTYKWEDTYSVVAWGSEAVVLARGTADGQIIQPPEIVIPAPDPEEDLATVVSSRSFARREGNLLVLVKLFHLDSWEQNPIPVELVSYILSMEGELLHGPTSLVTYDSHVHGDTPMVTWSGQHFGVCFSEPFDTFKFMALDEDGELARDPVSLFWEIPPVENKLSPCDVIAIDEDTFAVALRVYTEDEVVYPNGTYITYVTTLFVE